MFNIFLIFIQRLLLLFV